MTKKVKKLIMIVITIFTIIINMNIFSYKTYSANGAAGSILGGESGLGDTIGDIIHDEQYNPAVNPDTFDPKSNANAQDAEKLANIGNQIIGFLQIVGSIISVIVLIILGIKYMIGSAEEKANYKKTMGPYLIGAIMIFAITSILGFIVPLVEELF